MERRTEAAEAAVGEAVASEEQAKFALNAGKANVTSITAPLDGAKFDLTQTVYRAHTDGFIMNFQAREGTMTTRLRATAVGAMIDLSYTRVGAIYPMNLLRNVAIGDPVELAFLSVPGHIYAGKVIRLSKFTGEGQTAPDGTLPEAASIRSKGRLSVTIGLDDDVAARELSLGEAGAAAIYSRRGGPFHIISKIYLRMISLAYYLPQ